MTDQEINVAVAECCGWTKMRMTVRGAGAPERRPSPYGVPPGRNYEASVTDYCTDLNAMRSARGSLSEGQLLEFFRTLERIVERDHHGKIVAFAVGRGTAHQEAEAFLRTVGKWRDA